MELVFLLMSLNVLLVLLVLLLDRIMSALVPLGIMSRMVLVKYVHLNVMVVKSMESAVLVLIHLIENLNRTVIVQLDFSMMDHQHARLVMLFVRLVPTQLLVLHVSVKTTDLWLMDNVSVHQDSIKSSMLITLSLARNAVLNVKNVQDQLFALTVMLPVTDSSLMMRLDIKLAHVLQDTVH